MEKSIEPQVNTQVDELLEQFETKVISELKEATQKFSYKTYTENFEKIEADIQDFYKELMILRDDFDSEHNLTSRMKANLHDEIQKFIASSEDRIGHMEQQSKLRFSQIQQALT